MVSHVAQDFGIRDDEADQRSQLNIGLNSDTKSITDSTDNNHNRNGSSNSNSNSTHEVKASAIRKTDSWQPLSLDSYRRSSFGSAKMWPPQKSSSENKAAPTNGSAAAAQPSDQSTNAEIQNRPNNSNDNAPTSAKTARASDNSFTRQARRNWQEKDMIIQKNQDYATSTPKANRKTLGIASTHTTKTAPGSEDPSQASVTPTSTRKTLGANSSGAGGGSGTTGVQPAESSFSPFRSPKMNKMRARWEQHSVGANVGAGSSKKDATTPMTWHAGRKKWTTSPNSNASLTPESALEKMKLKIDLDNDYDEDNSNITRTNNEDETSLGEFHDIKKKWNTQGRGEEGNAPPAFRHSTNRIRTGPAPIPDLNSSFSTFSSNDVQDMLPSVPLRKTLEEKNGDAAGVSRTPTTSAVLRGNRVFKIEEATTKSKDYCPPLTSSPADRSWIKAGTNDSTGSAAHMAWSPAPSMKKQPTVPEENPEDLKNECGPDDGLEKTARGSVDNASGSLAPEVSIAEPYTTDEGDATLNRGDDKRSECSSFQVSIPTYGDESDYNDVAASNKDDPNRVRHSLLSYQGSLAPTVEGDEKNEKSDGLKLLNDNAYDDEDFNDLGDDDDDEDFRCSPSGVNENVVDRVPKKKRWSSKNVDNFPVWPPIIKVRQHVDRKSGISMGGEFADDDDLTDSADFLSSLGEDQSEDGDFERAPPEKRTSYRIRYDGPTSLKLDQIYAMSPIPANHDRFESTAPPSDGGLKLPARKRNRNLDAAPSRPPRNRSNATSFDSGVAIGSDQTEGSSKKGQPRPDVWVTAVSGSSEAEPFWKVKRVWAKEEEDIKEKDHTVGNEELFQKIKTLVGAPESPPAARDGMPKMPTRSWHVQKVVERGGKVDDVEAENELNEKEFDSQIQVMAVDAVKEIEENKVAAEKVEKIEKRRQARIAEEQNLEPESEGKRSSIKDVNVEFTTADIDELAEERFNLEFVPEPEPKKEPTEEKNEETFLGEILARYKKEAAAIAESQSKRDEEEFLKLEMALNGIVAQGPDTATQEKSETGEEGKKGKGEESKKNKKSRKNKESTPDSPNTQTPLVSPKAGKRHGTKKMSKRPSKIADPNGRNQVGSEKKKSSKKKEKKGPGHTPPNDRDLSDSESSSSTDYSEHIRFVVPISSMVQYSSHSEDEQDVRATPRRKSKKGKSRKQTESADAEIDMSKKSKKLAASAMIHSSSSSSSSDSESSDDRRRRKHNKKESKNAKSPKPSKSKKASESTKKKSKKASSRKSIDPKKASKKQGSRRSSVF